MESAERAVRAGECAEEGEEGGLESGGGGEDLPKAREEGDCEG